MAWAGDVRSLHPRKLLLEYCSLMRTADARPLIACITFSTVAGGSLGWLLQLATYPHVAGPRQAALWGAAAGAAAVALVLAARPIRRPQSAIVPWGAYSCGVVSTATVMAVCALLWLHWFDQGLLQVFHAWAVVHPRRHAMALAVWQVRYVAAAVGLLLFAYLLLSESTAARCRAGVGALLLSAFGAAVVVGGQPAIRAYAPMSHGLDTNAASVVHVMRKVAAWQLQWPQHGATDWHNCPWHAGLLALHRTAGDAVAYEHVLAMSERQGWQLGPQRDMADDQCIGSIYLDLGWDERQPQRMATTAAEVRRASR